DMSRRRNRSPKIVMSSQNHTTNINTEKTSTKKLVKVKPPGNNMLVHLFDGVAGGGAGSQQLVACAPICQLKLKPPPQPPFLPAHEIDLLDRRQRREAAQGEISDPPLSRGIPGTISASTETENTWQNQ